MLYNFSLDICEKFFSDPYFWKIFVEYIKVLDERIKVNPVLAQFPNVYKATVELIQKEFRIEIN